MKKKLAILSLVLIPLIAVACGKSDSSKESVSTQAPVKETTTTTIRATTTTIYSLLDTYVDTVKSELPGASRSELIDLGKQACTTIRAYGSVELAILGIASDPSWTPRMAEAAGFVMGAAIPVFCPEFTSELRRIV
jgi:hypothetical protein